MAKLSWLFRLKADRIGISDCAMVLILGAGAFLLLDYLIYAFGVIGFPFDWGEDEGYQLYYVLRLVQGRQIYFDPNRLPMLGNPYPPFYPLLGALLVKLTGPSLTPLRLISFFASLSSSFLIYEIVRSETRKSSCGLLAAFLFLGNRWTSPWYQMARVDSLAVSLSLLALYLAYRSSGRWHLWVLSVLALAAAIYTRQSSVYMLPLVVGLGWRAGKKRLAWGALLFSVLSAGAFLWLNGSTHGLFYKNIFTYTATDYSLSKLGHDFGLYARHFAPMLVLSALCAALAYLRKLNPLWAHLLLVSAAATALGGKLGAAINYYIPLTAALAIASAIAMDKAPQAVASKWRPVLKTSFVCAVAAQLVLFWAYELRRPSEADLLNSRRVAKYINAAKGEVLTERRPAFAALAGKDVLYDAVLTSFLYFKGYWRPGPLVRAVEDGRFSVILLMGLYLPPELRAAAEKSYMEVDKAVLSTWYGSVNYRVLVAKTIDPGADGPLWRLAAESLMGKTISGADEGVKSNFRLGVLFFNGNYFDRALIEFMISSTLGYGAQHSFWNAGAVFYKKGLYPKAARLFLKASRRGPEDARLRLHLANSFFLSGLLAKAAAEYKTAIILEPGSAIAYKNLAIFYLDGLKDKRRAARYLRASLRFDPHQPGAAEMKAMSERLSSEAVGR